MERQATAEMDEPLLLRREDAARRLNISLRSLDTLIATKQIRSLKIGKRRLVSEQAILDFIKKVEGLRR